MEDFLTKPINTNHLETISSLERLKNLRRNVNWRIAKERSSFLDRVLFLIKNWEGQLPNLRDIFRPEEIDWLLTESVLFDNAFDTNSLIDFVIDSGYKDELVFDEDGKPLLRRTTPLHQVVKVDLSRSLPKLFKIYQRADANYTDESGLSHFHVACMNGFDDVVKRFLELGQDSNCIREETGDAPLHLALHNGNKDVVESLLRNGANPDLVNKDGFSSIHLISYPDKNEELIQVFFNIIDEKNINVQIDALDKWGHTALHLALICHNIMAAKCLLTRNSNPNLADSNGWNVWHTLCQKYTKIEWDQIIFENCSKRFLPLAVNSLDKKGLTPLNHAIIGNNLDQIEMIIRRGACPNIKNLEGLSALNLICKEKKYIECLNTLFNVSEKPLYWAIVSIDFEKVEKLLKFGVRITTLRFPKVIHFAQLIEDDFTKWSFRLYVISSLLCTIEMITAAGYNFDKYDALAVMKFLEINISYSSPVIDKVHDDSFIKAANLATMEGILIADLINGNERQIFKKIELKKVVKFAIDLESKSSILQAVSFKEELEEYIIEKLLIHRFYHRWALDSFSVLFPGRLPTECIDMILKELTAEELRTICYAELLSIYKNHELVA